MIILDSSFVIAYHNERDVHHLAAAQVMDPLLDGAWGESLLPEHVFLEVVTVLAARIGLAAAVDADFERVEGILVVPGTGTSY